MTTTKRTVLYTGPKAEIASLTGSPWWGRGVGDVARYMRERGFTLQSSRRYPTPYGKGPLTLHFRAPSQGRSVIWIPSYGGVLGEDWERHNTSHKVFWILWKAGVKVLVVGGTSGTADWRAMGDNIPEEAVQPGDFVLPWSFVTDRRHRGLPDTPFETVWPAFDMTLDDPFCPELAQLLANKVRAEYSPDPFRRVHTPDDVRTALVLPKGITFETDPEIWSQAMLWRLVSEGQPGSPPIVSLHGDCVNPVLARMMGIHMLYYHLPANWAQGIHPEKGLVNTLHSLYMEVFPKVVMELEAWMWESVPIPDGSNCSCLSTRHIAPEVFARAMTH